MKATKVKDSSGLCYECYKVNEDVQEISAKVASNENNRQSKTRHTPSNESRDRGNSGKHSEMGAREKDNFQD